jgi:hypothetical protein
MKNQENRGSRSAGGGVMASAAAIRGGVRLSLSIAEVRVRCLAVKP